MDYRSIGGAEPSQLTLTTLVSNYTDNGILILEETLYVDTINDFRKM